jgi:hypothetical protein
MRDGRFAARTFCGAAWKFAADGARESVSLLVKTK